MRPSPQNIAFLYQLTRSPQSCSGSVTGGWHIKHRMVLNCNMGKWGEVLDTRIREYVNRGVLVRIPIEDAWRIAPIGMVTRDSDPTGPREVLDFTGFNAFIVDSQCMLPKRQELLDIVAKFRFAAIDLKSCYTNIKLHIDYLRYCCVGWRHKVYKFTHVLFGNVLLLVTRPWTMSLSCTPTYLDDFLLLGDSENQVMSAVNNQLATLTDNGLPVNVQKSSAFQKQKNKGWKQHKKTMSSYWKS